LTKRHELVSEITGNVSKAVINFATVEPNKILMTINGLSDRFVLATS